MPEFTELVIHVVSVADKSLLALSGSDNDSSTMEADDGGRECPGSVCAVVTAG